MNNLEKLIEDHWIDCKYETCKSALPEFKEGCKNCETQIKLQVKRILRQTPALKRRQNE